MNRLRSDSRFETDRRVRGAQVIAALVVILMLAASASSFGAFNVFGIFKPFPDDSGNVQSLPSRASLNATNKFFDPSVGTNGQACVTCHQPAQGFTIHVANIDDAFTATQGLDPIFRVIDTADRPDAVVTTLADRQTAYALVQSLGVIRIGKTIPGTADFAVQPQNTPQFGPLPNSNDPQHPGVPSLSVFRRPLVNTNVRFDSSVLWDGRAAITDMDTQVKGAIQSLLVDPVTGPPPDVPAVDHQIALFMTGVFTDQVSDTASGTDANGNCTFPAGVPCGSGRNSTRGARAGIVNLLRLAFSRKAPCLFDVVPGSNPPQLELTPFTPKSCTPVVQGGPNMTDFKAWLRLHDEDEGKNKSERSENHGLPDGDDGLNAGRLFVARGEELFNNVNLNVPPDLQGQLGTAPIHCTTCHSTTNIGNNPDPTFFARIGTDSIPILTDLAAHDSRVQELLDRVKTLPEYCLTTVKNDAANCGTHPGDVMTTDPGRALVSGKIADVGKFKPPVLRGLAARSPYFHNAAAGNIQAAVHFYNARFNIGLSEDDVNAIGAFLEAH